MKKFLLLSFTLILNLTLPAQEKAFSIKTGAGYYTDMLGWVDGPIMWLEGSHKLKTGFFMNARISVASIDWNINEGLFKGYRTAVIRQMIDITFSHPVKIKGSHYLEPAVGFKLKREYNLNPDVAIENISGQLYLYPTYSDVFYEIGFTACLDYYYQFQSGFYLGLRADTNIIWALGFEGLTFSPMFGFRF